MLSVSRATVDPVESAVADRLTAGRRIVLVTGHRRESWGEPLARVAIAVAAAARRQPDVAFVVVGHPNPALHRQWEHRLAGLANAHLVGPLDYASFVRLLSRAWVVLTDSGGVQEEAPTFGVPVLVTRDVTERPEGIQAGLARLVGTQVDVIVSTIDELLEDATAHQAMTAVVNPYGDGAAAERIAEACGWLLGINQAPDPFRPTG
jgi:UDP-N-acetylglucosamine 2-epimerase (non-hydrolysing)